MLGTSKPSIYILWSSEMINYQEVCVRVSVAVLLKFLNAPVSLALLYLGFLLSRVNPVCLTSACSQFAQSFSCRRVHHLIADLKNSLIIIQVRNLSAQDKKWSFPCRPSENLPRYSACAQQCLCQSRATCLVSLSVRYLG